MGRTEPPVEPETNLPTDLPTDPTNLPAGPPRRTPAIVTLPERAPLPRRGRAMFLATCVTAAAAGLALVAAESGTAAGRHPGAPATSCSRCSGPARTRCAPPGSSTPAPAPAPETPTGRC
ncbi:MAG: hypothetical protein HOW97_10375 [Catenulispora sp.]|nr:hypothetical protein [Catenulispora sp.]